MNIPGYEFDEKDDVLGEGGMGCVYKANQVGLGRTVALKVLSPDRGDSSFTERFLREAQILADLSHNGIVAVHEVGVHDSFHYLSMEFMSGGDLARKMSKPIEPFYALHVVKDIAEALAHIHKRGYVHRDVKPENVLFRKDGSVALGDFGIAKSLEGDTRLTETGTVIGTPAYLSPEQIRGEPTDGRADIYALGVLLHTMLTGEQPFKGTTNHIVTQQLSQPLPKLPEHLQHLTQLIDRMTAKRANERLPSADDVAIAISRLLDAHRTDPIRDATTVKIDQGESSDSTWLGMPKFDAVREERFKVEHTAYLLPLIRVTLPLGIFLYLAFYLWDVAQPEFNAVATFSVRFSYAVLVALIVLLSFTRFFRNHAQWILALTIVLAVSGIDLILYLLPDGFVVGYGGVCFAMMFGSLLLNLRFLPTLFYTMTSIAITNGFVVHADHSYETAYVLVNTNFFVGAVGLGCIVYSYVIELDLRTRFAKTGTIGRLSLPWVRTQELILAGQTKNQVFACYRRDDTQDVVGRVCDRLEQSLGAGTIQKDVDIVPLGEDFRVFLGRVIKSCEYMLVFIGPSWVSEQRRETDPVYIEIELALNLGLKVIPILVHNAEMPSEASLPNTIKPLAYLNAARLRPDPDFTSDVTKLFEALTSSTTNDHKHA